MLRTYFCYLDEAEIPTEKIKRVLPDIIQRVFLICSLLLLFFFAYHLFLLAFNM